MVQDTTQGRRIYWQLEKKDTEGIKTYVDCFSYVELQDEVNLYLKEQLELGLKFFV